MLWKCKNIIFQKKKKKKSIKQGKKSKVWNYFGKTPSHTLVTTNIMSSSNHEKENIKTEWTMHIKTLKYTLYIYI